jgi:hypothetical protein
MSVSDITAEDLRSTVLSSVRFADNSIQAVRMLRRMDPMVFKIMRDPSEFVTEFAPACPSGAMSICVASSILSIMANASLFEKLMGLAHTLIAHYADQIVRDASAWGIWCLLAALETYKMRGYDLFFSMADLPPLPGTPDEFPSIRGDLPRLQSIASTHPKDTTRLLAGFLALHPKERVIYLTSAGGTRRRARSPRVERHARTAFRVLARASSADRQQGPRPQASPSTRTWRGSSAAPPMWGSRRWSS